jgi:hypothetical protein
MRPVVYDDLTSTSVKVEREALKRAKEAGINVSEVLREALAERLGSAEPPVDIAEKFRGLPAHVVSKVKRLVMGEHYGKAWAILSKLNSETGRDLHIADVEAIMPRF